MPRKSIYFSQGLLAEIGTEAERLDRSVSWILQRAWQIYRDRIREKAAARVS